MRAAIQARRSEAEAAQEPAGETESAGQELETRPAASLDRVSLDAVVQCEAGLADAAKRSHPTKSAALGLGVSYEPQIFVKILGIERQLLLGAEAGVGQPCAKNVVPIAQLTAK